MQITEIKYSKRFNLGNYEAEEIGLVADVMDGKNISKCLEELKTTISKMRSGTDNEVTEKVETKETSKSEEKRLKTLKKKAAKYDRNNESHKALFIEMLNVAFPKWSETKESKAKGKEVSMKMEGLDFLDEKGKVVDEFYSKFKKLMK